MATTQWGGPTTVWRGTVIGRPAEKASGPAVAALVPFRSVWRTTPIPASESSTRCASRGSRRSTCCPTSPPSSPTRSSSTWRTSRPSEIALFREARALWQLTPKGREVHAEQLASEAEAVRPLVEPHYPAFLELNEAFKGLCGDWQLRDGAPNDHTDAAHDEAVIGRLLEIDSQAQPVVIAVGTEVTRLSPYAPRLSSTAQRVAGGDHQLFTGVMCGSYHDVWMELHEDLILTLGIDRAKEGSF